MHWMLALAMLLGCERIEEIAPAPPLEGAAPPAPGRRSVRMTVDQLARSLPVVAGADDAGLPITWSYPDVVDAFALLGPTLGDPDYVRVTDEPAVADALYVKFMSDVALNVCAQMTDSTLVRFESFDENLRYLHLRFLGERLTDQPTSDALRAVFDAGGWQAVCVALIESPPFHIY
ncbi:MAG TPA: hypothetical protein VFB62_02960 [Polyangiaceae bacterium]|nr:hypothetical protein [Polyangiaceae bacterium]